MTTNIPYLENQITQQIQEIDSKIKSLQSERLALERLLLRARRDEAQAREPIRSNSVNRVLVENRILETLRQSKSPVSNRDLLWAARSAVFDLKDSTFRSHIKRMKDGGKIVARGKRWVLPDQQSEGPES
ncbi:hypothetical protein ABLN87_20970 [Ruegeria sp. SCPT10]|uniref:hypothetical protein n=1 Tax=Ruegeria sp. SCP10 TaxID=3141377 RepID=UPI00333965E5